MLLAAEIFQQDQRRHRSRRRATYAASFGGVVMVFPGTAYLPDATASAAIADAFRAAQPLDWPNLRPANYNQVALDFPKVVAFAGLAGAGKSTAADILVRRGYSRVKFAGPLKAMMRAIGLTDAHIEGDLKEIPHPWLQGQTPRHAMQTLGTEWGRRCIGEQLWTGLWWNAARDCVEHGGRIVTDDCRFQNEAETVRSLGGVVLRVVGRGGIAGSHSSEAMDFDADDIIENTGSLADLESKVLTAMEMAG